jgi:microcystin-dependent protein
MSSTKIRSFYGDIEVIGDVSINNVDNPLIPLGIIIMWNSATVPSGWALCDGTNGTPDLRDKFILGAGSSHNNGQTGGATNKTLTVDEIPSHTHTLQVGTNSTTHNHSWQHGTLGYGWQVNPSNAGWWQTTTTYSSYSSNEHTHNTQVGDSGSGDTFEILPPFYTLSYIMKL